MNPGFGDKEQVIKWARREIQLAKASIAFPKSRKIWLDDVFEDFKLYILEERWPIFSEREDFVRMYYGLPLTPITDNPDDWGITDYGDDVCNRLPSFRRISRKDKNGNMYYIYHDENRYKGILSDKYGEPEEIFSGWNITVALDYIFPIKLPYYPSVKKYYLHSSLDGKGLLLHRVELPDGSTKKVDQYICTLSMLDTAVNFKR